MQIAVLVERLSDQRFRARSGEPLGLTSEGNSLHEAVDGLRLLITGRIDQGALMMIDIPTEDHPWMRMAGMFPNDSLTEAWEQAVTDYRKQADEEAE